MDRPAIDNDVPMPRSHGSAVRWPFAELEVGQSFAIDAIEVHNVRAACSMHKRRYPDGKRFTIRIYNDGYRCWRVK